MPCNRSTPREYVKRTLLYSLERFWVKKSISGVTKIEQLKLIRERRLQRILLAGCSQNADVLTALLLRNRATQRQLLAFALCKRNCFSSLKVLYMRSTSKGPVKEPADFTELEFREQFRFRKAHFFRILNSLQDDQGRAMMSEEGPITLRYARAKDKGKRWSTMRADKALMILLRRMAAPCRWCDLQLILHGSRTGLSDCFNYMLSTVHARYSPITCDIRLWKHHFAHFAAHLASWGCPFDCLVAIFDGHFQPTCRPGGDACVYVNLKDYQTFAGKERLHGVKYQCAVMPNGMAMVWGPWRGTVHDATAFYQTGVLDALGEVADELGRDYIGFGDSAYPLHRFMQHILKPHSVDEPLTRLQRRYNALMARFRIVVENIFAECVQCFGFLRDRHNLRLGSMQVGKLFPVGIFLYNVRALLYGCQTATYFGQEECLLSMSVEEYIKLGND